MNIDRIVGKRIEIARRERFWNQHDLADTIGVSQNAISRWESGLVSVTADNLWRLCEIFGKRIEYFFEPLPEVESKKASTARRGEKQGARG